MRWTQTVLCTLLVGFALSVHADVELVPYSEFKQWHESYQRNYIRELAVTFYNLESAASNVDYAQIRFEESGPLSQLMIPFAVAADCGSCLVGGVKRSMASIGERCVCPTKGRGCSDHSDGFLCGTVYGNACVEREPISDLSERCINAAGSNLPDESRYRNVANDVKTIADDCQSGRLNSANCQDFVQKVQSINTKYRDLAVEPSPRPAPTPKAAPQRRSDSPGIGDNPDEIGAAPEEAPAQPAKPKKQKPKKNSGSSGNCLDRYQSLGSLACVACGLENYAEADTRAGVKKWISLLGIMARRQGARSEQDYQMHVADMVASYGYCTDSEYGISLPGNTSRWLAGDPVNETQFATSFGLQGLNKWGKVDQRKRPMAFADAIFSYRSWRKDNPQMKQWHFRSMLKSFQSDYSGAAFNSCGRAASKRLTRLSAYKMCTITEGKWKNGVLKVTRPDQIAGPALGANNSLYDSMAQSCGIPSGRQFRHFKCDHNCWSNRVFTRSVPHLPYCQYKEIESGESGRDPGGGKGGEPEGSRDGKGGEGETGRPDGGGASSGKGGEASGTH